MQMENEINQGSVKKATILAMVIFSIGYMISEPNLDGFNLEEALEYINNDHLDSLPLHLTGFITSFISNIPLLAAIIYCWARSSFEGHHSEESHSHSKLELLIEFAAIGSPFALMGSAAYLDTIGDIIDISKLSIMEQIFAYSGAAVSGLITAFGATKLHAFHAHGAMKENGGGISGFFKGLYKTFISNVWAVKQEHETKIKQVLAVFNEVWKKYGIVGVHGFLGNFAANVFLKKSGLEGQSVGFDVMLKIFLPIAVMLYEGNTEARSLDEYKQKNTKVSYSLYSKLVVTLAGLLHTVPAITSLAMMIGSSDGGPFSGRLYNSLIYLAASSLLLYPSVYGFVATTIPGFEKAAKGLQQRIRLWLGGPSREDYQPINSSVEEPSAGFCSRLLTTLGFLNNRDVYRRPDNIEDLIIDLQTNGSYQTS